MKKDIIAFLCCLFAAYPSFAATVQGDADSNGALDIGKGGTNSTSASNARTALGVPATAATLVGDCTVGPCLDGSSDGGNIIKLWAGTGSYWTALQGGAPAANRSWRLPIAAPPSAGTTRLMNMDEFGQMGFVDPATFATALGSDDNYVTDAEKTVIGNTSGTNTGDQDLSGLEPALGNPSVNGYVLASSTTGERSWIEMTGGGTGIAHATSDNKWYGSRNGGWVDLTPQFSSAVPWWIDKPVGTSMAASTLAFYNGELWRATQTHTKDAENYPQSPSDYWEPFAASGGGASLSTANTWTAEQTFSAGVVASEFLSTCEGTGDCYSIIPNNTVDVPNATFTGKSGIYNNGHVLTGVENGVKSPLLMAKSIGAGVQAQLVSGTNIKTVNGTSLLGSGNITVEGTGGYPEGYLEIDGGDSTAATFTGEIDGGSSI